MSSIAFETVKNKRLREIESLGETKEKAWQKRNKRKTKEKKRMRETESLILGELFPSFLDYENSEIDFGIDLKAHSWVSDNSWQLKA